MSLRDFVSEWSRLSNVEVPDVDLDVPPRECVKHLVNLRHQSIAPLRTRIDFVAESLKKNKHRESVNMRTFSLFAQRIANFIDPPPEYNDPTGQDTECLPGRSFPCPNTIMLANCLSSATNPAWIDHVMENWENTQVIEDMHVEDITEDNVPIPAPTVAQPTDLLFCEDSSSDG